MKDCCSAALSFPAYLDYHRVKRANGKNVPQQCDFMAEATQRVSDLSGHALVTEEAQAHAGAASNCASSRA